MKIKIRKVDTLFSNYIRDLYQWKCVRCHGQHDKYSSSSRQGLHTSHYWSRGHEGTRFEPDNCIALCFACHKLWGHGEERERYKEFMIKELGLKRFKTLDVQAHTYHKRDDKSVLMWLKSL